MGDKNAKRGSKGDSGDHNPVNTRPPEEYLALVGGASNAWSGFVYHDPAQNKTLGMPHPRNLWGVSQYVMGYPGKPASTHDMYWGNFIDPAIRLFKNKIAKPKPGDIITIMVYYPSYEQRQKVDWRASPFNQSLHRNSPWVKGDAEYDPSVSSGQTSPKDKTRPPPRPPQRPQNVYEKAVSDATKAAERASTVHSEEILDHDILMRLTSRNERDRRIIKQPTNNSAYMDYIHDIPKLLVYGPMLGGSKVQIDNIFVKVLFFDEAKQVTDYMATGQFPGEQWVHMMDIRDEEQMANTPVPTSGPRWDAAMVYSGRGEAYWKKWLKADAKPPQVNRKKIKINRFDYFGHSGTDAMFLRYGWSTMNTTTKKWKLLEKGDMPMWDVGIYADASKYTLPPDMDIADFKSVLKKDYFTAHARSQLWGCFLGDTLAMDIAPFFDNVVACEKRTNFERILDNETNMPFPSGGEGWTNFPRP